MTNHWTTKAKRRIGFVYVSNEILDEVIELLINDGAEIIDVDADDRANWMNQTILLVRSRHLKPVMEAARIPIIDLSASPDGSLVWPDD